MACKYIDWENEEKELNKLLKEREDVRYELHCLNVKIHNKKKVFYNRTYRDKAKKNEFRN